MLYYFLHDIVPQLFECSTSDGNKLFFPLQSFGKTSENETMNNIFNRLRKQLKSIDKRFSSFKQIRASVITSWLKEHGLRRTQYLAGHRQINTTENYLCNNLDGLTKKINNLHPF